MATVLIIDDEPQIREIAALYVRKAGYEVLEAGDGRTGLELFEKRSPAFVVLDLMLPDRSGEEVCRAIRRTSQVPILMLTAKVREEERLNGFRLGADDYLTKPFSPRELLARIEAILKRTRGPAQTAVGLRSSDGVFVLSPSEQVATKHGVSLELTPTEFRLLALLLQNPGRAFTRDQLVQQALGEEFQGFDRTIDAHIKNLRLKIEDHPHHPVWLKTVFGVGYKWDSP